MLIFIIEFCIVIIFFIIWNMIKYNSVDRIPGPSWIETFKFFFLMKNNEEIYSFITTLPLKYGSVVKLWLKPFKPVLVVADPKIFENILTSKEHVHKTAMYDLLHHIAGNGLVTNKDVVAWRNDRKILGPVFSKSAVSKYALTFSYHADKIRQQIDLQKGKALDIQSLIHHSSLSIILEYLIQERMTEDESTKLVKALDRYLEILLERAYSIYKNNDTIFSMLKSYKPWQESGLYIHNTIATIFEKQKLKRMNKSNSITKKAFMDLLLDSTLDDESIISHLKTFILAGYETTAVTITFALLEISKRPDIQDKLHKEYLRVVGDDPNNVVTFDHIEQLIYTKHVIKEALRMYPAIPLIQRKLKRSLDIDGVIIPKDIDLVFSVASLHSLQFDRPEEFDPERFQSENAKHLPPSSYAPFSLGPRDCIGRRVAMTETVFIVADIIKHFTLHPVIPEHKVQLIGEISMKSKNGVPIIFKSRR